MAKSKLEAISMPASRARASFVKPQSFFPGMDGQQIILRAELEVKVCGARFDGRAGSPPILTAQ
jgi:hypothetical protein